MPSDIPEHNQVILAENLKTSKHLEEISEWTKKKKMQLNVKKTKSMIFNFSKKNQFTTKLSVNNVELEIVKEAKLLGTIITSDLKWNKNTKVIVKKAFGRMQLLFKSANFTKNRSDLRSIYLTFIRSILEQSAVVWHSSLTKKNRRDLERVQRCAVRVIMGEKYENYKHGLQSLRLETLEKRREILCLSFAKKCIKNDKVKSLFPRNSSKHKMKKRNKRKIFKPVKSSIPYMVNLLNEEYGKKNFHLEDL